MGSSAVTILVSPVSFSFNAAARVVDFPDPVGPETITIPFVAWFLLEEIYNYAALFTLLIAVSDFLDGFIARYFKVQSELGSYLDAIADKAFVISIFILIGNLELLPVFIIIIIISRDIIILGSFAVTFLVGKKIEVKPTKISKLNTFFQFCLVITTMLSNINGYEKYFTALMLNEVLITVVLICTLLSLVNYINYWFKNIN